MKMKIYILTAFPEIFKACLNISMFKKAHERAGVEYLVMNLRDFSTNKHKQIDDTPYGGGSGMVLKPEPFFFAYDYIIKENPDRKFRVIYPTPQGKVFNTEIAKNLAREDILVFFCGHYKGVDERVIQSLVTDEISIGDYVLTGGELPTLIIIDTLIRHIPGVLHSYESAESDSFEDSLLEGPVYTKPAEFRGLRVPEVLLSGNHELINKWRYEQRLKRTKERRKDLIEKIEKEQK